MNTCVPLPHRPLSLIYLSLRVNDSYPATMYTAYTVATVEIQLLFTIPMHG